MVRCELWSGAGGAAAGCAAFGGSFSVTGGALGVPALLGFCFCVLVGALGGGSDLAGVG